MKNEEQTNIEKYEFEPIKGYPMLKWTGKRPFRSTQYFPAQLKEVYGKEDENGWINKIFWGDNLQVMSHLLREFRGKIDFIYIDPPYDSKATYSKTVKLKSAKFSNDSSSFEEAQYSDIWNNDSFLQWMYDRLVLCKELLSSRGSIVLHCDWHKSHHLRCILDEIFGEGGESTKAGFRNEIIWRYSSGGKPEKFLGRKHDNLYWYTKGAEWFFDGQSIGEERGTGKRNNMKKGIDEDGRTYFSIKSNGKEYRYYEDEKVVPDDVWEISHLQQKDPERIDYPTQKPEKLISRLIKAMSPVNGLVFDFFMGSGTTQAVAHKEGRRFIGADINLGAVTTTVKRLIGIDASFEVYNVNNYDVFRNPVEAKRLLIDALEIQSLENYSLYDGEKDGKKVKIMPVNRIATKEDLNELLANFPYKKFEERKAQNPNKPVEEIMLVCMGHEPGLAAVLENESGYKLKVEVVDILRDKSDLTFKYDSEAVLEVRDGKLIVEAFYPRNLLQKLSQQKEDVTEWREMVESIMIDWNYDGAVMEPVVIDIPEKDQFVQGVYDIPQGASNIKIKITDLLSESYEEVINHG